MTLSPRTLGLCAALTLAMLSGCASTPEGGARFETARQAYLDNDYHRALVLMEAEAKAGNPHAQYTLGYMHYNGMGTPVDTDKALVWIRRAAEQGDSRAIEALTRMASVGAAATPKSETAER